jgi:O-methyltransferase involved in polyketide biosynthesis
MDSPIVRKDNLWQLGLDPREVGGLLREYGWVGTEHMGDREYLARYMEPAGRDMPVTQVERFVAAEKVDKERE